MTAVGTDTVVGALWRFPVKSLRGERLDAVELTADGVAGDRLVHIQGDRGPLTGRTRRGLLTVPATTGPDGRPLIDGHPWDSEEAAAIIRDHGGDDARPAAYAGPERFDVLNLLVATDGAVAELGVDVRRLRPNIVVHNVPGTAERDWPGRALAIGDALVGVHSLRQRCVVTTIDPDDGSQNADVLRDINRRFDGRVALNSWVIRPGRIQVGDSVRIVESDDEPRHAGGWVVGAPYRV